MSIPSCLAGMFFSGVGVHPGKASCHISRSVPSLNEIEVGFGSSGNWSTVGASYSSSRPAAVTAWRIFGSVRSRRNVLEIP